MWTAAGMPPLLGSLRSQGWLAVDKRIISSAQFDRLIESKEVEAFARDVEDGRRMMNQPPKPPQWG